MKRVYYCPERKQWVSEPAILGPKNKHKPKGRRRASRDAVRATISGAR